MDWESHLQKKNPIQKIKKVKNLSEIAACEEKTTSEKEISYKHRFLTTSKLGQKNFKPQITFSLHFIARRDQYHLSNLTSKIKKMGEQILKKSAHEVPNNSRYRFAAIK